MANQRFIDGKCAWHLTLNGEKKTFGSNLELNAFLLDKLNENPRWLKREDLKVIAAMNSQEIANAKIADIKQEVANAEKEYFRVGEDTEMVFKISGSIGVTKFLQSYPCPGTDAPTITPFNEEAWKEIRIKDLKDGFIADGKSTEEASRLAEKQVKIEMSSWDTMAEIGEEIHSIFQKTFDPEAPDPKFKHLKSDTLIQNIQKQANEFKESLHQLYGENCTFYAELPILSKELETDVQQWLGLSGNNSINGKIDLLVVDEQGRAHIYDFKVSRKKVDSELWGKIWNNEFVTNHNKEQSTPDTKWWDSTKREAASHQLAMYSLMLSQKGINVVDAHIVPVKTELEYEDDTYANVTGIKSAKVQYKKGEIISRLPDVISGKYANAASNIFHNKWKLLGSTLTAINSIYSTFFPRAAAKSNEQSEKRSSLKYYKDKPSYTYKLKPSDKLYNEETDVNGKTKGGYRYRFVEHDFDGKTKYFKTEEELDAHIKKYIERVANSSTKTNIELADRLLDVFSKRITPDEFAEHAPAKVKSFIQSKFARYFDGDWAFRQNEELNSLGIFIFEKNGIIDIVSTTTTPLRETINLGLGTSIQGKTKKNRHINPAEVLSATGGHMELMRIMSYVALSPDNFKGKHISTISVINMNDGMEDTVENTKLINNYNQLCDLNPEASAPKVKSSLFLGDAEACLFDVRERIASIEPNSIGEYDANQMELNSGAIRKMLNFMETKYQDKLGNKNNYNKYDPIWQAYVSLNKALLFTEGHSLVSETDVDNYYRGKTDFNGLMLSSMQYSPSVNIRALGDIVNQFANTVRKRIQDVGWPMKLAFKELYEKHGTGASVFKTWFETDEAGNITSEFKLKDPSHPDFAGDATSRKALDMFLKTMARLRWGDKIPEADLAVYKSTGEYYQVPLTEAVSSRQLRQVGIVQTVKNKIAQYTELTEDVFAGTDIEEVHNAILNEKHLFNKMRLSHAARNQRIEDAGGIGMFETDLERVMNEALYLFSKESVSKDYLPVISGYQLVLKHMDEYGGGDNSKDKTQQMSNIKAAADKLIRSKVYGENIIEGEKLRALYKWLSVVKAGFTTLTLSLNVRGMLRESLQGIWTGTSRAAVETLPGVDEKTYVKAISHVTQEAHKNFSSVSKLQQLNEQYAMANQSLSQISNQRRLNWANIKHWGKDTLFLTATAPDFLHRVSILVAKMMGDGCWEAHTIDENGKLIYDFKKDARFKDYVSNNTNSPDYLKQKSLYLKMLEQFKQEGFKNKDGSELKEGDDLPQAYDAITAQSVKNYSDLLYGHYDDESRSLLCDTFVGGFFLQYKTFITAKLEQWTMEGGIYNTNLLTLQKNSDGETLYEGIEYTSFNEEGEPIGMPERNIITETQFKNLSAEDQTKYRVYYDYSGLPMEGMLNAQLAVAKCLLKCNFAELEEMWKDKTLRGYWLLGLHDLWVMMLFSVLVDFVFTNITGAKDRSDLRAQIRKADPMTQLAYNVISGSLQDSQFQNVIGNFTDAPPVWTSAIKLSRNIASLASGKITPLYALTRSVGAISDFQGIVKRFQD